MNSGYVYEYTGVRNWRASSDERWPVEMYTPKGDEKLIGYRLIDKKPCQVWKCPDGKYRAQIHFA